MRRLTILAVQAAIAVLLLETALRLYHPLPFRLRGDELILPVGLTYRFDNHGDSKLDPITIHTRNRFGFRGPDPPADFPTRLTIITVGGSTTECFPLSDGKTWPDVVARELARTRPDVWVNNAGLDGHSTVGHLALLQSVIVPLHPKMVLILAGVNDVGLDTTRPAADQGVFLIDLARLLPKDSRYFYDLFHFGNDGAAEVGKIVAAKLAPHLVR